MVVNFVSLKIKSFDVWRGRLLYKWAWMGSAAFRSYLHRIYRRVQIHLVNTAARRTPPVPMLQPIKFFDRRIPEDPMTLGAGQV